MSPRGIPRPTYPVTATVDQIDDYHGTLVTDPYRWLEDLDAPETAAWVAAQNEVTAGYLDALPARAAFHARLTELWDHDKFGVPMRAGDRYLLIQQSGLQNQFVVLVADALDAEPRVLLDPNTWSADGTVALVGMEPSPDGRYLAYGIADGGSDWQIWRIVEIATGTVLDDDLRHIKFTGISWLPDGSGFYYSRYDAPDGDAGLEASNYFHKLTFHRVGTQQSDDVVVYERPDHRDWLLAGVVSEDGRWLIVHVQHGATPHTALFLKDLADPGAAFLPLREAFDAEWSFVASRDTTLWFRTNAGAPHGRMVAIDATDPTMTRTVIDEADETLLSVDLVGGRFFAQYLHDAYSEVRLFALDGTPAGTVDLPGIGTAAGFTGRSDDPETFYLFTSYTVPSTIYRYDVSTETSTLYRRPEVAFDPDAFETTQVFYESRDGTRVPMFLTHRKGLVLDGSNPTLLYGYGGFNISMTPTFAVSNIAWLELGGVYAVACLRGGGEYGESWHLAGTKLQKQNVFDDFIAAAEHLIDAGYTSTPKLAINGGSNGGLLVGACITQRPDLFGAARIAVGVLDMLRFHRFTIGWAWVADYGSADDHDEFEALYAYSPLHNIRPGTAYPATLITTADHDDRVVPSHSFKFAATLQPAQAGDAPILIRIDVRAGHGMGKPTAKLIDEAADVWAFLTHNLGVDVRFATSAR